MMFWSSKFAKIRRRRRGLWSPDKFWNFFLAWHTQNIYVFEVLYDRACLEIQNQKLFLLACFYWLDNGTWKNKQEGTVLFEWLFVNNYLTFSTFQPTLQQDVYRRASSAVYPLVGFLNSASHFFNYIRYINKLWWFSKISLTFSL